MKLVSLLFCFYGLFIGFGCKDSSTTDPIFEQLLSNEGGTYDLWIHGGKILNGVDSVAIKADVLVKEDEIKFIGQIDSSRIQVKRKINAEGKIVTPGFIDMHAHGDPLSTPAFQNFLAMGATTICLGQDGFSPAYRDINRWMQRVSDTIPGVNIASFIGHSTLRNLSQVKFKPEPNPNELDSMKQILSNGLTAGCFGMSTGLEYNPGGYAQKEELLALAKVIGEKDGMIMSHIRNEDDNAVEDALKELLNQGQYCNVHVSHLKVVFGKGVKRAEEILNLLNQHRNRKYNISADIYPYNASFTGIGIVFPKWAKAPNNYETVKRNRRKELLAFLRQKVTYRNGPEATLLGTPPYTGKTLAEISKDRGKPFEEVLLDEIGPRGASGAYFVMNDSLQQRLLRDPAIMVGSDGSPSMRHPRGYGTFAKIIEEYVNKRQLFSLAEAIRKMTSLSAQTLGLQDRGLIAVGKKADILVFDPQKVKANATYSNPHQLASGFDWVIVNGQIALQNGQFATQRFGRMLKRI